MPNCSVCSNPLASYHFGAIVCRACAIFFRRFVFRKKEKVYCNCFLKRDKLCRSCRMKKCLAAGMKKSEIQGPRDNICQKYEILNIEHPIQLRTLDRISEISQNYSNLENSRTTVFQKPTKNRKLDVLEFTVEVMTDIRRPFFTKNEIRDIFEPFWNYRYFNVNRPLVEMKFGDVQNMALFGILLWDPGYTNLSETLAETCHTMRKIIFRELNSFLDNSGTFFYTLEALNLIERAEQKCREEIHLCGIHNIEFDQERKNMILWDK
ncbi:hypothetical protein L5515_009573 [Caenorhabditis briggsae]|uniref:Nuclear receptor domain-containing protein n=1 Tax=Caenorhabditis briggsae TaxID=6238 RepID=A0AAE9JNW2_CAEBR|nr:hypothetical protein L5515_009573 [Caenorhabditis briggsae]